MDTVIDLGQGALKIPPALEPVVLFILEALEFLDEVELELRAEPRTELECNVLVSVGSSAITSSPRLKSNCTRGVDPFSGCERKVVEAGLFSKGLEFETFKIRVVDFLPDANQFKRIAIAHPVIDQRIVGNFFAMSAREMKSQSLLDSTAMAAP